MHKQGSTQQPRRFAGLQGSSQDKDVAELYVLGLPATLFRDDDTAQAIEEERHLVPWQGDYATLVDRFDGRNLLDDLRQFEQHAELQQGLQDADEADPELAHERYCDLDYSKEWQLGGGPPPGPLDTSAGAGPGSASENASGGTSSGAGSSESDSGGFESEESDADMDAPLPPPPRPAQATPPAVYGAQPEDWEEGGESAGHSNYAAVSFQYDYPQVQEEQQGPAQTPEEASTQVAALPGPPYRPPFDVPSHLHVLPDSERVDKVIAETARFVRKGGGQVEVLLRVRQAGNPMFSFLQPGDPLHPYYTWIVKTDPKEIERPTAPAAAEPAHAAGAPTHGPASPSGQLDRANSWLAGIQYSDADSEPSSPAAGLPLSGSASAGVPEPAPSSPVQFGPQLPPHLAAGVQPSDAGGADAAAAGTNAVGGQEGGEGAVDGTSLPGRAVGPASPSSPLPAAAGAAAAGSPGGVAPAAVEQGDDIVPLSGSLSPSPAPAAATAGTPPSPSSEAPATAAGGVLPAGGLGDNQQAEGRGQQVVGSAPDGTAAPVAGVDGAAGTSEAEAQMLQVINKLVGFVKRSGAKFEATVRKREANNPAFSFLQPSDPHHHLYRAALAKALGSAAAADQLLATSQAYLAQSASTAPSQPAVSLRPLPSSGTATADAAGSSSTAGAAAPLPAASAAVTATAVAAEAKPLQVVAVVGPEKKPLVLKANPPLAAHQAMRVAAQQAAALIAKQAAAAKAGGAQEPAAAAEASVPVDPQQALQQAVLQATRVLQRTGPGAAAAAAGGAAASESTGPEAGHAAAAATPPTAGAAEPGAPAGEEAEAAAAAASADAAAAEEDEAARAQKLLQRRLKARALLAQKLAERQKEEEAARAHAVASHRQALLLGGDNDAPSSEAPSNDDAPQDSTSSAGTRRASLAPLMGATPAAAAPGGLAGRAELPPSVAVAMHRLVMRQAAAADEDLALLDELEELEEGELPAADLNPSPSPNPSLPAAASVQPGPGAQGTQLPAQGEPGASPADAAVAAAVESEPAAQPGLQQPAAEEPPAVLLQGTGEAGIQPPGHQPLQQQQQQDEEMGPEAPEGKAADTCADLLASPETARAEIKPALPPGVSQPGASAAVPVSSGSSSGRSSGAATSTSSISSASPSEEESSRKQRRRERHSSKDGRRHSPGRKHRSRDRQRGASPASPHRSSRSPHRSSKSPRRGSKSRSRPHHDKESKHHRKHHRRHRRADDGSSGSEHNRSSSRRRHRHGSSSERQVRHKRSRSEHDSGTDDSSDGGRSRRAHKRHRHDADRRKHSKERGAGDSAKRHSSRGSAEEGSRARSAAGSKGSRDAGSRGGTGTGPVVVVAVGDRITLQPASSLPSSSTTSKPPLPPQPAAAAAAGGGGAAAGAGDLRSRLRSLLEQKFKL